MDTNQRWFVSFLCIGVDFRFEPWYISLPAMSWGITNWCKDKLLESFEKNLKKVLALQVEDV
ncbi:hypothetical protein ACFCP7_18125, partial [Paenibacillus elgii]